MSTATPLPETQPAAVELSSAARRYARKKALRPYLVLAPALLITIGILIPFITAIVDSFSDLSLRGGELTWVGFDNYVDTFTDSRFWHSAFITALYAFAATGVEMLIGIAVALLLNEENWASKAFRTVFIFPLMIAPVIGALIWKLMTNPSVGILRFPLGWFGLSEFRWSADPNWALFTVVLIDVWIYTPFVIILVLAGLRSLPKSPYEAALIDGGSPMFVFWNLTLPMLKPVLYIALIFRLMTSLQEFGIIYAMTEGGPGDHTMSIAIGAYNKVFQEYDLAASIPQLIFLWACIYAICFVLIGLWRNAQKVSSGAA